MKLKNDGYYVNQHSCFLLQYHLVLVTKYRHHVITGDLENWLKEYTLQYFNKQGMIIQAMECMPDHVHILFDAPPNTNLANFINAFKSASSRLARKQFSKQLAPYYWKPYFWSMSYFLGTVSDRTKQAVVNYIEHQKD